MSDYNHFTLIGRLAEDIDVRLTVDKSEYALWKIIINEPYKDAEGRELSTFLSGTWYPKKIDIVKKYPKGTPVLISGKLVTKEEFYSDGGKKYTPVLRAEHISKLPQTKNKEAI